jgi:hypothetical protein
MSCFPAEPCRPSACAARSPVFLWSAGWLLGPRRRPHQLRFLAAAVFPAGCSRAPVPSAARLPCPPFFSRSELLLSVRACSVPLSCFFSVDLLSVLAAVRFCPSPILVPRGKIRRPHLVLRWLLFSCEVFPVRFLHWLGLVFA